MTGTFEPAGVPETIHGFPNNFRYAFANVKLVGIKFIQSSTNSTRYCLTFSLPFLLTCALAPFAPLIFSFAFYITHLFSCYVLSSSPPSSDIYSRN
ncbi:hypothetical protein BGS_0518 [Beggiatoa sp. SS]|nr:hypothetical protein BGS_0518 [Beggiatoa sp. SS]